MSLLISTHDQCFHFQLCFAPLVRWLDGSMVRYYRGDIGMGRRFSGRKKKTKLQPRTVTFKKQGRSPHTALANVAAQYHMSYDLVAGGVGKPEVAGVFAGGATSFVVDKAGHGAISFFLSTLPLALRSLWFTAFFVVYSVGVGSQQLRPVRRAKHRKMSSLALFSSPCALPSLLRC
jgi:hypothetical protein